MKLALATTCSNEGRYLLEWVAWHTLIGFGRFLIFTHNNREDDVFLNAKSILERTGVVEFHEAVKTGVTDDIQMDCYNSALKLCAGDCEWMMPIDLDEYLVPTRPLVTTLGGLPSRTAQVHFSWLVHGSAGEMEYNPSKTHFEKFNRCAPHDAFDSGCVKSIVRVARALKMNLHIHKVDGQSLDGDLLPPKYKNNCYLMRQHGLIGHVSHFSVRSREEFEWKANRGYASDFHTTKIDEDYWTRRDRNERPAPDMRFPAELIRLRLEEWASGIMNIFPTPEASIHENQITDLPNRPLFRPCA